ncbi:adenosine deaminase [Aliiglaciecola sp. CAU 1673]|uniref:adenosine deaminase n=1 Tax=Aliiglaciecola sp. CAU 1673 TaxID=3032595 RepID=UPI0023DB65C5|nr:adenosine deaminase [Aliiglaciecola sp. CAU 1673]MDF2178125.1 adenosine deaminase [Aliiglaciecola sp. CAU 1673]
MIDPQLPLVDLHRHLDGNIRPRTIWELAQQYGIKIPADSFEALLPLTQIQDQTSDLLAFLQKLDYGVSVLADTQACYRVAMENMEDAFESGLDYVELRFSPYYMAMNHNLNMADVVEAVVQGVRDGSHKFGVQANLIGILSRTFGVPTCKQELDALLAHKDKITALDLAGDELGYPAPLFIEHFKLARDAGWQITVHAGEADGPQSIWNAIEMLGAKRIGHGVAAARDDKLMEYMAKHEIAVESCPTSNYQTATVKDLSQHPMPLFLERGLLVTLNTDDPAVSNIDLANEYKVAHETLGLSEAQLKQVQQNGVKAAFLTEAEKKALFAQKQA